MKPYPERKATAALDLYDQGVSFCEIARRLGVARQTVRRWVIPGERERHNYVIRRSDRRRRSKDMNCPHCQSDSNRIIDTRIHDGGNSVRRRRHCYDCARRYTTLETAVSMRRKGIKLKSRNRSTNRETGSRQRNTAHEARIAAHRERILRGE